jgi:hypothetical protein
LSKVVDGEELIPTIRCRDIFCEDLIFKLLLFFYPYQRVVPLPLTSARTTSLETSLASPTLDQQPLPQTLSTPSPIFQRLLGNCQPSPQMLFDRRCYHITYPTYQITPTISLNNLGQSVIDWGNSGPAIGPAPIAVAPTATNLRWPFGTLKCIADVIKVVDVGKEGLKLRDKS